MSIAEPQVDEPDERMVQVGDGPASRDVITAWMLDNLVWILGLIPIMLSAIRIYAVAGGDEAVLRALVVDLDVVALFLATVLPVLPYYWFFLGVVLLDSSVFKSLSKSLRRRVAVAFPAFLIGAFTIQWNAASGFVVLALFLVSVGFALRAKRWNRGFPGVKIGLALLAVSVLLMFTAIRFPWIPAELITIEGQPVQRGYVLSDSEDGLTVMWRGGGLQLVDPASVRARQFCTTESRGPSLIFAAEAPDVQNPTPTKIC